MKTRILETRILNFQLTNKDINLYNDMKNIAI